MSGIPFSICNANDAVDYHIWNPCIFLIVPAQNRRVFISEINVTIGQGRSIEREDKDAHVRFGLFFVNDFGSGMTQFDVFETNAMQRSGVTSNGWTINEAVLAYGQEKGSSGPSIGTAEVINYFSVDVNHGEYAWFAVRREDRLELTPDKNLALLVIGEFGIVIGEGFEGDYLRSEDVKFFILGEA